MIDFSILRNDSIIRTSVHVQLTLWSNFTYTSMLIKVRLCVCLCHWERGATRRLHPLTLLTADGLLPERNIDRLVAPPAVLLLTFTIYI